MSQRILKALTVPLERGDPAADPDGFEHRRELAGALRQLAAQMPDVYGGISAVDNSTQTVISSAGVAVQVTIFDTNNPSNLTTPDHTNDHIEIQRGGDYFVAVSATVNSVGGGATRLQMTVQKNNGSAELTGLHVDRNIAGGAASSGSVSMSGIVSLSAGDTVEVWLENETSTQNYTVEDISLSLMRIGRR